MQPAESDFLETQNDLSRLLAPLMMMMTMMMYLMQQRADIFNKYVRLWGLTHMHTCRSHVHTPRELNLIGTHRGVTNWNIHHPSRTGRFVWFWPYGGAKLPKCTIPHLRRLWIAKFYAASFILGGEIRNHTNTQIKLQTNSNWCIHTLRIGMCG